MEQRWAALVLVLCSVVALVAAVNNDHPPLVTGAFTETTYTATLSGEQVVPQSMTLGGLGTAFCQLNRERNFLSCHISHIFPDALAVRAWIGHAPRASNGPSVYEFTVALDDFIEQVSSPSPVHSGSNAFPICWLCSLSLSPSLSQSACLLSSSLSRFEHALNTCIASCSTLSARTHTRLQATHLRATRTLSGQHLYYGRTEAISPYRSCTRSCCSSPSLL